MSGAASRSQILESMGVRQWRLRNAPAATEDSGHEESLQETAGASQPADYIQNPEPDAVDSTAPLSEQDEWGVLRQQVSACTNCELHRERTQTVFGVGDTSADWLIVGEAPGADEDAQGEPFVGKAGQLLNEMLLAAGFERSEVYIANTVKCRPPENRKPKAEEMQACATYLDEQIRLLQPKFILVVGQRAAVRMLGEDDSVRIGNLRGKTYSYGGNDIPVVVTYHPAYYLRTPSAKRKGWEDLLFARRVASGVAP